MTPLLQQWVKAPEASIALCRSIKVLQRLRADKTLPVGLCWTRTTPSNLNSHVLYNIPACLEVLSGVAAASEMEQDQLSTLKRTEVSQA